MKLIQFVILPIEDKHGIIVSSPSHFASRYILIPSESCPLQLLQDIHDYFTSRQEDS